MEDVDLVFSNRDINHYGNTLGDLLDHMDGLKPKEDISVILTTNSIERMEAAIKDRPGRISQCVYFGAPPSGIRKQYIEHYSRDYDCDAVDIDQVLSMSKGATPAFIKEWIHRTVQFAFERLPSSEEKSDVSLSTNDFSLAYQEMRLHSNDESNRIVGFIG